MPDLEDVLAHEGERESTGAAHNDGHARIDDAFELEDVLFIEGWSRSTAVAARS